METNLEDLINNISIPEIQIDSTLFESKSEDININIDYPHFTILYEDLYKAINLSLATTQLKTDNSIYNSIIFISNNTLNLYSTNELSHFTMNIPLIGNNTLNLTFSISISLLQKVTKLMGKRVLFYVKDNLLYVRLLNR